MKKAKIMLSAIAVFAVVGGALAFKAKNNHSLFLGSAAGECTVEKTSVTFTSTEAQAATYGSAFYTIDGDQPNCSVKTTIYTTTNAD